MRISGRPARWVLWLALALISPAETIADYRAFTKTIERVVPFIEREMAHHQIIGLSIALVDQDRPAWVEGFGYADRASGEAAGADTVYRAGSITKLITTAAVMKLAESGTIDIDQPVQRYLPNFQIKSRSASTAPITVRNVLSHHSGLPTDINKGLWTNARFTSVLKTLQGDFAAYSPGFVLSYSNVGFTILGCLIESAVGQPFEHYVHTALFEPLQMTRSALQLTPLLQGELATAYAAGEEAQPLPIRDMPAMGLYTTVRDLARFMAMLLSRGQIEGHTILHPSSVAAMFERQNVGVALDFDDGVGLGFFLDGTAVRNAGPIVEHGGNTLYFGGHVVMAPKYGLGVVVLGNSKGAREVSEHIAERTLIEALQERYGISQRSPPQTLAIASTTSPLHEPVRYVTDWGLLSIGRENGKLCACTANKTLDLLPRADGWLELQAPTTRHTGPPVLISQQTVGGQDVLVAQVDGRAVRLGSRLPDSTDHPAWRARLGDYRVLNPDPDFPVDSVCLRDVDGVIHLHYRMPKLLDREIAIPVQPLSETEAVTVGLGRTRGETIQAIDVDGEEQLLFSGYRLRRKTGFGILDWFD